jgi:hypothetical protein
MFSFSYWSLYPQEKAHGTHWRGCWMGPTGLDAVVKKKNPTHCRESNLPIIQPEIVTKILKYQETIPEKHSIHSLQKRRRQQLY